MFCFYVYEDSDPELRRHEADHGPDVVLVYSLAAAAFFALSRIRREIIFYMKKKHQNRFFILSVWEMKVRARKSFSKLFSWMIFFKIKSFAWGPRISGHAQISGTASLYPAGQSGAVIRAVGTTSVGVPLQHYIRGS